ncbi:ABC transporter ATP-binding protein [Paenibacillus arenosi]|uniref:ABC transporter ATP-binding protein n=1 Tax=Paenibacillus arenosi TaxID=2774142 RepID=A0ABR9B2G7_9BACL|nr:ABC transporter ATP-binding protein [Paenibacillus arenosi]MBD8500563.1 ABC transporter ATP-binding protein [Paenibacillus arenosi]
MTVLQVDLMEAGYEAGDSKISAIKFDVQPGELVGLIGPNGAGKSTTIKSILGIMQHVKGSIHIGSGSGSYAYVPEQPEYYDTMTLWEHLELAGASHDLSDKELKERAMPLIEEFGMLDVIHHLPGSFSKGMRQKMMLIIAFLLRPPLYIVDEPFVGLDPRATRIWLDKLKSERERGAGVLMSTHVLDTAERICDRFVLIQQGAVVAHGTLQDIRHRAGLPNGSLMDCFEVLT